ncbi:unnamed protein product, partial [Dovyalis caffra]
DSSHSLDEEDKRGGCGASCFSNDVYARGKENIIFSQTNRDGDEVSTALIHSIASATLHGGISQHQRDKTLNDFVQGKFTVHVLGRRKQGFVRKKKTDSYSLHRRKLKSLTERMHQEFPPPKRGLLSKLKSLSRHRLQQINEGHLHWDLQSLHSFSS